MISSTQSEVDPQHDGAEETSGAPGQRSLMVRPAEMGALSTYSLSGAGGAYFDGTPQGVSMMQLLHALRRRWLLALLTGLMIGLPTAAIVWLVTPDNYEVQATLRVGDVVSWANNQPVRDPNAYEQYRKTQAALIKSRPVLSGALNEEGIMDLPIIHAEKGSPQRFLVDEVSVVAPLGTEVLQIRMYGPDPLQLVKIVNAIKESYIKNIVSVEHRDILTQRDMLAQNLRENENELGRKRSDATKLENDTGSLDSPEAVMHRALLEQQASTLMGQIVTRENEISNIKGQLETLKERSSSKYNPPQLLIDQYMEHDPSIADLEKQQLGVQSALNQELGVTKNPTRDASVKQLRAMLGGVQSQLETRRNELLPKIMEQLKMSGPNGQNMNELNSPEELKAKLDLLEKDLASKREEYKKAYDETLSVSRNSAQLKGLKAEILELDTINASLKSRLNGVDIELQYPSRVTVLDNASIPEGSSAVFRIVVTILSGVAGLVLGSGAVVGVEYQSHRLSSTGELSTRTGLRVLGTVPNLTALSQAKGMNGSAAMQGILAESVDSIRTMLLQQSREDAPRVILITSAGDREGKTTVASHLAASLARSGRRTLLVDGDLRAPSVHAIFSVAAEPGLSEVLRSEATLEAVIQPTQVSGLMLVAAGQCDYQAIAALSHSLVGELFQTLREQFEFIVIDSAPVLSHADTLLMGVHVDAAVLSVRRDVSQLTKVHEARQRMESVGIRVLGAVVNGITETGQRPAYALPSPT